MIDNSDLSPEETAIQIDKWIMERMNKKLWKKEW